MKKNYLTTLLVGLTFAIGAAQTNRSLSDFNEVKVSTGVRVTLVAGDSHKAVVEVENCSEEEVMTEVRGSQLVVKFINQKGLWTNHRNRKAHVTVHYKSLSGLDVSSGGMIETQNRIDADHLTLEGASGGQMELDIMGGSIETDVASGAVITVEGQAQSLKVDVSSGGVFSGYDLSAAVAIADASSGGVARITVTDDLRAGASSGGSISYKGNPEKVDLDKSISGSIRSKT